MNYKIILREKIIIFFIISFSCLSYSQSTIQPGDYNSKGKVYLNEWIEVPVGFDDFGVPTPDNRRLNILLLGPENISTGTIGEFYIEITPEYSSVPMSDPYSEFISYSLISIAVSEGYIELGPLPKYEVQLGNDLVFVELTDISDFWRKFYITSGQTLEALFGLTPVLGQIMSISNLAGGLYEWKYATEPEWTQIWETESNYDIYSLIHPRHVEQNGLVRKYAYTIPFRALCETGEMQLIIHNISVNHNLGTENSSVFHDVIFQVFNNQNCRILSNTNLNSSLYFADQINILGLILDFDFVLRQENQNTVLSVNCTSTNTGDWEIEKANLALTAKKGTGFINRMPYITRIGGNQIEFASLKSQKLNKFLKDLALFGVEIAAFNTEFKKPISYTKAGAKVYSGAENSFESLSFSESIYTAWQQKNNSNIYYLPKIKIEKFGEPLTNFLLEIPLELTSSNYSDAFTLCGDFTIRLPYQPNTQYYQSSNSYWEDISFSIPINFKTRNKASNGMLIGFILDSSGSMKQSDPKDKRKSAVKQIINLFTGDEMVFIVDFDGDAKWMNPDNWENWNRALLFEDIDRINSDGNTNIGLGLETMQKAIEDKVTGSTSGGVLLFTDGRGSYNNEAEWFMQRNIPVHTISYTEQGDALLMSKIAQTTGGIYLLARDESDVIAVLFDFFTNIAGYNKICSYTHLIQQGETISYPFYIDYGSTEMVPMISWHHSKVGLSLESPSGKIYSENATGEWFVGENYTSVKIPNPEGGEWKAYLSGITIPKGGEPVRFEVSGNTPNVIKLVNTSINSSPISFMLKKEKGEISIDRITPIISIETPRNQVLDISQNYKNGSFQFIPTDGPGSYNIDLKFETNDNQGNKIQRHLNQSVFIGDHLPSNIAQVTYVMGRQVVGTTIGKWSGNQAGIKCYIYAQGGSKMNPKAVGYVKYVLDNECQIDISEFFGGASTAEVGDIVELDLMQWQNDIR